MTTRIYKDEFKGWYLDVLKNRFPYSETEKVITLHKVTEDIHNHIHSMMFVNDDEELERNLTHLVCFPQSDETVIEFRFNYEYDN